MFLSDMSIKRPVFIVMLMVALIVVGVLAYTHLPVDLMPDMTPPVINVRVSYPGAGPEVVESAITKPLEDALSPLSGIQQIESTSQQGSSNVQITYALEYPLDQAASEVRERVAATQRQFPKDAGDPTVQRFDPNIMPFMMFTLADNTGKMSGTELRAMVDNDISPQIQRINGVAAVDINGGRQRQIDVLLSLDRLQGRGITPDQVSSAISAENQDLGGGIVTDLDTNLSIRTPGTFTRIDDIANVVVTQRAGVSIRVKDVADVQDSFRTLNNYSRLDGNDAVVLMVRKQSGTNTLAVAAGVNALMKTVLIQYPNLTMVVTRDDSGFIKSSVDDTLRDLIIGALLACVVVLLFFRNWRMTVITVIGLPVIIIGTFFGFSLLGFTINMITLLALSLCIGLLIDDAIVVRENMFRHIEAGEDPPTAASRGTAEIALAVLAMTLSIVSVFMPVAFATGTIGRLFKQFGITVSVAVFISLFEAFTLAPMLASRFDPRRKAEKGKRETSKGASMERVVGSYRGVLRWSLAGWHRWAVVGTAVALCAFSVYLVRNVGQSFAPSMDQAYFAIQLSQPPGGTLEKANSVAMKAEDIIRRQPEVDHLLSRVSANNTNFDVRLKGPGQVDIVQRRLRPLMANVDPVTKVRFSSPSTGLTGSLTGQVSVRGRPIQLVVQSAGSLDDLDAGSNQVLQVLSGVPGILEPDRSVTPPLPDLRLVVDRSRAAELGFSTSSVGATVRGLVAGNVASSYQENGRQYDIMVRLRDQDMQRASDIMALPITSRSGTTVRLAAITSMTPSTEPNEINRLNRQRTITVGAGLEGRAQGDVMNDVQSALARTQLPPGVTVKFTGQSQQMQDSMNSLYFVMILALVFMYMVLASQLGSFIQPFVVMIALPLSVVGAMGALLVTHKNLDVISMIGMILLMGIVTKNSILLLDFANARRKEGASPSQAMIQAGQIRLRPVLMTSAALIMGMLPVAIGIGSGGEFRSPMAITVIGGLITSTLLTLVVVPVVYTMVEGRKGMQTEPVAEPVVHGRIPVPSPKRQGIQAEPLAEPTPGPQQ